MRISLVITLLLAVFTAARDVFAGAVKTDGSLGTASTLTGPNYTIGSNLGQIRGNNLLHSFSQFDLSPGDIATFNGPTTITNIISRITGGNPSSINGTIRSGINSANLYLLNPAGMVFGPSASLDVSGSFHASTADYLQFGQDRFFVDPLLPVPVSISTPDPTAFGFLKANPSSITVNGSLMTVPQGKSISLVAGGIDISDANLWAYGGTINLVSVASPGMVAYDNVGMTPQGFSALGPITITEARNFWLQPDYNGTYGMFGSIANLDASGQGGGKISIRGGSFYMTGGTIYNDTYGNLDPGRIDININGNVTIADSNITGNAMDGIKSGASIAIIGANVRITDGTSINTDSFTLANGSNISLKASNSLIIDGSLTTVSTDADGGGKAGDLLLDAQTILIGKGSSASSSANILGGGPTTGAGAININAGRALTLLGSIGSDTASGNSGTITIRTQDLNITDTGLISTSLLSNPTTTPRTSGDIAITANNVTMSGDGRIESRAIYSNSGSSGNITINAGNVSLVERSAISASINSASGTGGHINVTASGDILVSSNPINLLKEKGSISIDSTAGDAGHIRLEAANITVNNGAKLSTVAQGGTGKGGDITLIAHGTLTLEGSGPGGAVNNPSSIQTDTLAGGPAGTIELTAPRILVTDGGRVSSASLPGSTGPAGSITVATDQLTVNAGHFSSDSSAGNAGHIAIGATDISISNGATLSTVARGGAGNGGNIKLNATGTLTLEGSGTGGAVNNPSSIQTDTLAGGPAGTIELTAPRILVTDGGRVSSASLPGSTGPAGSITVATDQLTVNAGHFSSDSSAGNAGHIAIGATDISISNGATLSTVARGGAGNGGNIKLNATGTLTLEGSGTGGAVNNPSSIQTDTLAGGPAGTIELTAPRILVTDGGRVSSASLPGSTGPAGSITVATDQLTVNAGHFSSDSSAGNAGHIAIGATDISISNGATLSTVARGGAGNGGNIKLNATGTLTLEGSGTGGAVDNPSSIQTDTLAGGPAGTIELTAPRILVTDGGRVSSASLPGSTGPAGNIDVSALDELTIKSSSITTQSAQSKGGNISIASPGMMYVNRGEITASATGGNDNGGNVTIDAGYLTLNKGRVTAQAEWGNGGNLLITADRIFTKSADSLLSASSRYGQQGTLVINAPNTDVSGALAAPEIDILNLNSFIPKRCMAPDELDASTFRLLGSDGLPASPENSFPLLITK